jgi:hypothetical protein
LGAGLFSACMTGGGTGAIGLGDCVTGIWLFEVTGFGLSLEQPTVTEQMIRTAAKTAMLACLPQVTELRVSAMLRRALMRVMAGCLLPGLGALSNARGKPCVGVLIWRELEESIGGKRRGARDTVWGAEHAGKWKSKIPTLLGWGTRESGGER